MPRALVCLCLGCLGSRQSLFSGLTAPELGRVKSAHGSEALWSTWCVGGAAPGHTRADKLRRSNPSQALCKSTLSHRGRHRLPCGRAQTMCPCYDSKTQLSEPPVHPLLLASPGQAPAASLGHWLPAPYQYFFFFFGLTGFAKPYKSLNCRPHFSKKTDLWKEGLHGASGQDTSGVCLFI